MGFEFTPHPDVAGGAKRDRDDHWIERAYVDAGAATL
jgi:hypothetical protein